jgi:hypothetical protein
LIDGLGNDEDNLRISKNNAILFGSIRCHDVAHPPPIPTLATPSCDHAANTFTFQVSSFSDFAPVELIADMTGACCDHDPFGGCTDGLSQAECNCGRCEWTEDALCDDVECPRDSIPTVGAWGLAILTILLMIGAKIAFPRRTPSTLPW